MDKRLDLKGEIRPQLARMEDSLIFDLFERAKYKANDIIYSVDGINIQDPLCLNVSDYFAFASPSDLKTSFLDFLLRGTEELHAKAGRFLHPEEFPFSKNLPEAVAVRKFEGSPVRLVGINFNAIIKEEYLQAIRSFCEKGDDGHYGSAAVCDVRCLQDLSKRIHFGTHVAESKFQSEPQTYKVFILCEDREGIEKKLTNLEVEETIIQRVMDKGKRYGVDPGFIASFYRDKIIPLTKKVEIEYLTRRGVN